MAALNIDPEFFDYRGYPVERAKHLYRFKKIREKGEVLWTNKKNNNKGFYKFLLFYTEKTAAWGRVLCEEIILGKNIRFAIYSNGTVMIHCQDLEKEETEKKDALQEFINQFKQMKVKAKKYDDDDDGGDQSGGITNPTTARAHAVPTINPTTARAHAVPNECLFCLHPNIECCQGD